MSSSVKQAADYDLSAFHIYNSSAVARDDWEQLESFLSGEASELFDHIIESENGPDDIELGAPEYYGTPEDAPSDSSISAFPAFRPKGWVGQYPGGFRVTQDRVTEEVFQTMRSEVAAWIETTGPATARSLLRFLPEVAIRRAETYRSYSQRLIEETEEVLSHRPPVTTEFKRETSQNPRGRPLPVQTARERAKGRHTVVSQRVEFTLDTLPNLLLIRFHLELAGSLAELIDTVPAFGETVDERITYHREFVTDQFPQPLMRKALSTEFDDPRVVAETRNSSSETTDRVIDLWEGYRGQVPLANVITEQLDTAILPAEKIYELYVLSELLALLERVTDESPEFGDKGLKNDISIGKFTLRYDRPVEREWSRLLTTFTQKPNYRPDYVLQYADKVIWVGDAKFRGQLGTEDGNRFLRYLIDLLPAGAEKPAVGTIIMPDTDEKSNQTNVDDYQIDIAQVAPDHDSSRLSYLEKRLTAIP